jgi:hypothetical protein
MEAFHAPVTAAEPVQRRLFEPLVDFMASRIPLWLVMWFGFLYRPPPSRPTNAFLSGWFQWDAGFYMRIADVGYDNIPDRLNHRDTAFWPLFPLLVRGMRAVVPGDSRYWSAFILNHLFLFGALVLFRDIAEWTVGKERARLSTWLLLAHPFAFFYSAAYTESCFLFFAVLSFHFGLRGRWLVAGLAAACASATRAAGIGVTIALAVLYLEERKWSLKNIRADAAFVGLGCLGALEYMALLKLRFDDPFAFMNSMTGADWGVAMTFSRFVETLGAALSPWRDQSMKWIQAVDCLHIVSLGVAAAATLGAVRRLRPSFTVFCAVELAMISQVWCNGGRYVAPVFPVYLALAHFLERRPNWTPFVLAFSLLFQGVLTFVFGQGDWVG